MSDPDLINAVTAAAAVCAVVLAAVSAWISSKAAKDAAQIGQESIRIGKENTKNNEAMLVQAERHNRLSVKPILVKIHRRSTSPEGVTYTIGIENAGVGPAVIENLRFFYQKEEVEEADKWSDTPLKLAKMCLSDVRVSGKMIEHGTMGGGAALPAGGQKIFAKLFFRFVEKDKEGNVIATWTDTQIDALVSPAFEKGDYEVTYQSIYGEPAKPLRTWDDDTKKPATA